MSSSPFLALTSRPSSVKVCVPSSLASAASASVGLLVLLVSVKGTPSFLHVHQELVAEHADAGRDGRRDRRPEDADGRLLGGPGHTGRDIVAQVHEEIQIFLAPVAILNSVHDTPKPARPLAAGRTLDARLAGEELGDAPGGANHAN